MKQAVFIGDCDKTDLLFYVCKLLGMQHDVLLADFTRQGRYRHAYPNVEMDKKVQQYDNFDVAESLGGAAELEELIAAAAYEYVIIDADDPDKLGNFVSSDMFYLVTTYENPVMQGNGALLEAMLRNIPEERLPLHMTKVIREPGGNLTEDYLTRLYDHLPIHWNESLIYMPEDRDLSRKIQNQFSSTVKLKKISPEFKLAIKGIVESISGWEGTQVNLLWKKAERSK
ncbi:hypothetical protein V3851_00100 [Paenibacillus sp. M1]|uniref:Uncharacterized protein n=1 Tax=Paenibacillus haidiansis TaxID=1574488 RepID=A0ABU7VMV6_9BACL